MSRSCCWAWCRCISRSCCWWGRWCRSRRLGWYRCWSHHWTCGRRRGWTRSRRWCCGIWDTHLERGELIKWIAFAFPILEYPIIHCISIVSIPLNVHLIEVFFARVYHLGFCKDFTIVGKDLFWKGKLFPLKFTFLGQDVCVDLEVRCTYLNLDVYEKSSVMWMDTIVRIKLSPWAWHEIGICQKPITYLCRYCCMPLP